MRDHGRTDIYNLEDACWDGTLLTERPGYRSLEREGIALTDHRLWTAGPVRFQEFAAHKNILGLGRPGWVQLASDATWYTLAHEMGHAGCSDCGHGQGFRAAYVVVTGLLFGADYGHRLEKTFRDHDKLPDFPGPLVHDVAPIYDIDRYAGATQGGWRR